MTDELLLQPNTLYLSGPFGAGKTTVAIQRIQRLLSQERVRGDDILVLVPQRTLGRPYQEALRRSEAPAGALVQVTTVAALARSSVALYWPLVASAVGFADPRKEPTFLNLETTQYHMKRFVDEAFAQGEFDAIRLQAGRIVSQVLDNLNKAALHGFSIDEAYTRLELTVSQGEQMTARLNVLRVARRISQEFRKLCQAESLVDFSLWMQIFLQEVLENEWSSTHLFRTHRHLIFDNAEEDTFAAQELVRRWLPYLDSALILVDEDAGYRAFLGADPHNAERLADHTDHCARLGQSHITPPALPRLVDRINRAFHASTADSAPNGSADDGAAAIRAHTPIAPPELSHRFYPQMIDWAVAEIERLVEEEGVAPGQIAVLAPFVSDALRFSIQTRLEEKGIPSASHRPSRSLNTEPAARTLLTLAALGHPTWQHTPLPADVTLTLGSAIARLDPVRANVLGRAVYDVRGTVAGELISFERLRGDIQQRVTFAIGESYERLRAWLAAYRAETDFTPLDQFFARIFGELLSQPGFGFHDNVDAARIANQLVKSARNFRWAIEEQTDTIRGNGAQPGGTAESPFVAYDAADPLSSGRVAIGRAYIDLVASGALGALYLPGWTDTDEAVFIAPAYTFLMRNRAVDAQFWLDIGATGWWERLHQPLTHPYVLSRNWPQERIWSDFDEFQSRQESLRRLLIGLLRRARQRVFLGMSDFSESGMEQRGPLLNLLNRALAQADP